MLVGHFIHKLNVNYVCYVKSFACNCLFVVTNKVISKICILFTCNCQLYKKYKNSCNIIRQ